MNYNPLQTLWMKIHQLPTGIDLSRTESIHASSLHITHTATERLLKLDVENSHSDDMFAISESDCSISELALTFPGNVHSSLQALVFHRNNIIELRNQKSLRENSKQK